jgi:glucokinase
MNEFKIKTRVIGVDVGVEVTTIAIVDIRGNIIAHDSFQTSEFPDANNYVSSLSEKIVMLAEANGGYETIRSVGMSAPSGNNLTGCIENATNLPWKGVIPMAALLRDRLGIAVALANDAHITALGELAFGSAHGMNDFIVVSLSHGGVGSCIISNGKVHLGVDGFAGEVGHVCVEPNGRECGCGRRGCLEQYTSAKGIVRTARELMEEDSRPSILRQQDGMLSPEAIVGACEQGDVLAIEALKRVGYKLGIGLAVYASVIDPEAIVLTGPQSRMGRWLTDPMQQSFNDHVFHNIRGKVPILTSILDDKERDVLGASVLAWTVKEYSLFK